MLSCPVDTLNSRIGFPRYPTPEKTQRRASAFRTNLKSPGSSLKLAARDCHAFFTPDPRRTLVLAIGPNCILALLWMFYVREGVLVLAVLLGVLWGGSVAGGSDQSGYGHNAMGEKHRENDVNYVLGFFGFDGLSSPTCRSRNAFRANSTMARQCPQCHDVHLLGVESDLTGSLFGCNTQLHLDSPEALPGRNRGIPQGYASH
jgi:hypothetical protein